MKPSHVSVTCLKSAMAFLPHLWAVAPHSGHFHLNFMWPSYHRNVTGYKPIKIAPMTIVTIPISFLTVTSSPKNAQQSANVRTG